jgi:hypothetical protein
MNGSQTPARLDFCNEAPASSRIKAIPLGFSVALLRNQAPAAARLCIRQDRPMGEAGIDCSTHCELLNRAPGFSDVLRSLLHMATERKMPQFARVSFRSLAKKSGIPAVGAGQRATTGGERAPNQEVILWADTFNNYFHT